MKKLLIGILLVAVLLIPAACADDENDGDVTVGSQPGMGAEPWDDPGGKYIDEDIISNDGSQMTADDRMVVRNGDISIAVEDITQSKNKITSLVIRYGGYVVSSQVWGEGPDMRGWITIRIPDESFEAAMAEIGGYAEEIISESATSRDITEEYIDLTARLRNAEATEAQYLALLDKTNNVSEILNIYNSLSRVRAEIEQLKGQINYLETITDMSLISVSLEPASSGPWVNLGWDIAEVFKSAVRGIVTFGQWLATGAVWALMFSPLWGTALFFGIRWWRRRRKKKATA